MPKYFVYGALMGMGKFKHKGKVASLKDFRISFIVKGAVKWEPSFAALVDSEGDTAWGVVAELTVPEWRAISKHEVAYETRLVEVQTKEGTVKARALVLIKQGFDKDVVPSWRYGDMLYKASLFHCFPEDVSNRYLKLRNQGLKHTYYMRHLMPLVRKLLPHMPPKYAFNLVILGIPALVAFIILVLCLFFV